MPEKKRFQRKLASPVGADPRSLQDRFKPLSTTLKPLHKPQLTGPHLLHSIRQTQLMSVDFPDRQYPFCSQSAEACLN